MEVAYPYAETNANSNLDTAQPESISLNPVMIAKHTFLIATALGFMSFTSHAAVLALWTFETAPPTTAGPHAADSGMFAATSFASSNSGGVFSNPAGNGSAESFSSNGWNDGEYYQFLTSSTGAMEITVSYAQAASGTGPGDFQFQYSTDGVNFVNFGSVYAGPTADFSPTIANAGNVVTYDLSAITGLDNAASIGFRIAVSGTRSESGGIIAATGTFRVDDFTVQSIPEPSIGLLGAVGVCGLLFTRRRKTVR